MNIEEELLSALSDLRKQRKKNKSLKEEISRLKEDSQSSCRNLEETKQIFIDLKRS